MDRLWAYIFIVLVILSGVYTLPTCINYLKAKSSEENRVSDVEKNNCPPQKIVTQ